MGCGSSSNTAVLPLTPEKVKRDKDETGSKLDGRGDSAVSKGTTDSGVVMDNREIPDLPGAAPRKLPPLMCVRESETDRITHDGLLQQESTVHERQNSSEILEELLLQGIIQDGPSRESRRGAGESYSIMLVGRETVRRRPPARLQSLRIKKVQNVLSREEIEEKIRLAEERRKLKEEELKIRLRSKSARVRGPAPISSTNEDLDLTEVETLSSLTSDTLNPQPHSQIPRQAAEGRERVRDVVEDIRESKEDTGKAKRREDREEGGGRGEIRGAKGRRETGDGQDEEEEEEEKELTQVEELKENELLGSSGELECDSSFQRAEEGF